jgi:predicted RND superfamily exporter protein
MLIDELKEFYKTQDYKLIDINDIIICVKEFRLRTLPQKEKLKIKYSLLRKKYPPRYKEAVNSFLNYLTNYDCVY